MILDYAHEKNENNKKQGFTLNISSAIISILDITNSRELGLWDDESGRTSKTAPKKKLK